MRKQYRFGHTGVELFLPEDMPVPENMRKFEAEGTAAQMTCRIEFGTDLEEPVRRFRREEPVLKEIQRENLTILCGADRECRILRFVGDDRPYAVSVERSPKERRVFVRESVRPMLIYDTIFVSLLALEKQMIRSGHLILHSAYMCREGKAVLFSAPSETGKSTQADLWEKYRGTRTVNGDRSLLVRESDGWYAYGWPVCGSSEICHNEAWPVQAIVMLYQSGKNEIRRLCGMQAVRKLTPQITMNMWNAGFQMKALDLIEQIVGEVPIYELGCDISEDAVKCLEGVLQSVVP